MKDIVKRLRENILADAFKDKAISSGKLTERLIYERRDAADEIVRLRGLAFARLMSETDAE